MPRKTRRVSKKRKYKKRINVKRTRKYKLLRGGLGENDYQRIGIHDKFSFVDTGNMIQEFEKYVFGSEQHARKWKEILQLCRDKEIPFYILTSGNRLGVIRTLQLLELDDYVTEVLCNNDDKLSNPSHVSRDIEDEDAQRHESFRHMSKYQIIQQIFGDTCKPGEYTGIFIDNDDRNQVDHELCDNVEFIPATGENINKYQPGYQSTIFMDYVTNIPQDNPLYYVFTSNYKEHMYRMEYTNLIDISLLDNIIKRLQIGEITILFADFDGTMSPWGGALPFHLPIFSLFFNRKFNVSVTRTL
jgi:hypothetical protein